MNRVKRMADAQRRQRGNKKLEKIPKKLLRRNRGDTTKTKKEKARLRKNVKTFWGAKTPRNGPTIGRGEEGCTKWTTTGHRKRRKEKKKAFR